MDDISFNLMQLIEISNQPGEQYIEPTQSSFDLVPEHFPIRYDQTYYEVSVEKDKYSIWFEFDFGRPDPKDDKLTNIETGEKRKNTRKDDEAELIHQLFCYYHFSEKRLYISNSKKQNLFIDVLKKFTSKDFQIKTIHKTRKDFIELLKTVDEISFTEARNLFNNDSKKRQALIDLTGTDSPEEFKISAKYSESNQIKWKDFLNTLFVSRSDNLLKDLVICGTNEEQYKVVFNNDSFSQKIMIKLNKNGNGKFDPKLVKQTLIMELE